MQKHKVKLGKWSKTNKGYREVLVNGYYVGEVTKDCMWSVHCTECTVHLGSYRKMAEYLSKKVITIIENKQQYYTSVYNTIKNAIKEEIRKE